MRVSNLNKPWLAEDGSLKREVGHGPATRNIQRLDLNRDDLHSSEEDISSRNWDTLIAMADGNIRDLDKMHSEVRQKCTTNRPPLKKIDHILSINRRPLMICEFGFGDTTFKLLEWCIKNNAYLVTVEMPIAPQDVRESDDYPELYWWGVDRYYKKYDYCLALRSHPVAQKRWLWIMDDCYKVVEKIASNQSYRESLFLNGSIDYFYEDAIHDNTFHEYLFDKIKPFMSSGGVFTGDDNTPTYFT